MFANGGRIILSRAMSTEQRETAIVFIVVVIVVKDETNVFVLERPPTPYKNTRIAYFDRCLKQYQGSVKVVPICTTMKDDALTCGSFTSDSVEEGGAVGSWLPQRVVLKCPNNCDRDRNRSWHTLQEVGMPWASNACAVYGCNVRLRRGVSLGVKM